jgi:hypothetical protein
MRSAMPDGTNVWIATIESIVPWGFLRMLFQARVIVQMPA